MAGLMLSETLVSAPIRRPVAMKGEPTAGAIVSVTSPRRGPRGKAVFLLPLNRAVEQ